VGHNRRFSALSKETLAHFAGVKARQVVATVRAAPVPADSWYQDPAEGGGILFGDVCHFIDLAIWFAKSLPVEVHAIETPDPSHRHESWAIQMRFASGGIGIVDYVCGSHAGWERESVDVLGGGRSARLLGFRELRLRGGAGGKPVARDGRAGAGRLVDRPHARSTSAREHILDAGNVQAHVVEAGSAPSQEPCDGVVNAARLEQLQCQRPDVHEKDTELSVVDHFLL